MHLLALSKISSSNPTSCRWQFLFPQAGHDDSISQFLSAAKHNFPNKNYQVFSSAQWEYRTHEALNSRISFSSKCMRILSTLRAEKEKYLRCQLLIITAYMGAMDC